MLALVLSALPFCLHFRLVSLRSHLYLSSAAVDVLLLSILDSKEVSAAVQEAGLTKGQLESAINVSAACKHSMQSSSLRVLLQLGRRAGAWWSGWPSWAGPLWAQRQGDLQAGPWRF